MHPRPQARARRLHQSLVGVPNSADSTRRVTASVAFNNTLGKMVFTEGRRAEAFEIFLSLMCVRTQQSDR